MPRILKKLEIEDTSDCATCQGRDAEQWELLRTVKVTYIGQAWCPECGRTFEVMVPASEAGRQD